MQLWLLRRCTPCWCRLISSEEESVVLHFLCYRLSPQLRLSAACTSWILRVKIAPCSAAEMAVYLNWILDTRLGLGSILALAVGGIDRRILWFMVYVVWCWCWAAVNLYCNFERFYANCTEEYIPKNAHNILSTIEQLSSKESSIIMKKQDHQADHGGLFTLLPFNWSV